MAKVFLTPIDLSNLEIRNVVAQLLATDPTNLEGKFYYNTADHTIHFYNGTAWLILGRLDQISAPTAAVSLNGQRITSLGAPSAGGDAANQTYVLAQTVNTLTAPTTDFAMNSHKITGVTDPSNPQDAATKNYVDAYIQGIAWKESVRAATTIAGTLATSFANGQVIDGVTLATGNRILLKNQAAGAENGIYTVNSAGAPTRATDSDSTTDIEAAAVLVEEGTSNAGTLWNQTTDAVTVGTTAQVWAQIGAGTLPTAGAGLTLTGSIIDAVAHSGSGLVINADDIDVDPVNGIPVNRGGTNRITLTNHGVLVGAGTAAITQLSVGTNGQVLKGATGADPVFAAIDLTTDVGTSVLPIANGGTNANSAANAKTSLGYMTRFAANIGDGSTTAITVTHNLNTLDVHVAVFRVSDGVEVICDITHATVNTITATFAVAPTTNQYRVVCIG